METHYDRDVTGECQACTHSRDKHTDYLWNCKRDGCSCCQFEEEPHAV